MKIEDLTAYTETDPQSRLTVTATEVGVTGLEPGDGGFVYSDKGVNYFSGNWVILFEFIIDAMVLYASGQIWASPLAFSNDVDEISPLITTDKSFLFVAAESDGSNRFLNITESRKGTLGQSSGVNISSSTQYYCTFVKQGATAYLYVYSDSARTTLVGSTSLSLENPDLYQYIFAFMGWEGAGPASSFHCRVNNFKNVESDDPKYIIKNVLDATSVKKDDGVTDANLAFMFYNPYNGLRNLLDTYDAVVTIVDPVTEGTRYDAHQNKPTHHPEAYPVSVYVKDKSVSNIRTITATSLQSKIREQFRTLVEASSEVSKDDAGNPGYTLRIVGSRPSLGSAQIRAGGQTMWQIDYEIQYVDE